MKYRKKPVVIDAIQFTDNAQEIVNWSGGQVNTTEYITTLTVETLEGDMTAHVGDWIIRGVEGEYYPCAPRIFEKTYEPVA